VRAAWPIGVPAAFLAPDHADEPSEAGTEPDAEAGWDWWLIGFGVIALVVVGSGVVTAVRRAVPSAER
jgi:hypothetical protein